MAEQKQGFKRSAVAAAVVALELAGVLLAAAAGLAIFLYWRLQSGPVSLGLFRASAEFAIERRLGGGHDVEIARAVLQRADESGTFDLVLTDIAIAGPSGETVADLPQVLISFAASDVLRGALGPRRIVAVEPALRIERGTDRTLSLAYAPGADMLKDRDDFHKGFRSAELVRSRIEFFDAASGRRWRAEDGSAKIERTRSGYTARVAGLFDIDGKDASLSADVDYARDSQEISAAVRVVDAPVGDLLSMFYGPETPVISAPVTGAANIRLTRGGRVLSSRLEGAVGAGRFAFGKFEGDIASIGFAASFDPNNNRFDIAGVDFDVAGVSGRLAGAATIGFDESRSLAPERVEFEIDDGGVVLALADTLAEPLAMDALRLEGVYAVKEHRLAITSLQASFLDVVLAGALDIENVGRQGGSVAAELGVDGALDPQRVLRLWPTTIGLAAREFVATRVPAGLVDNVRFRMGARPEDEESGEAFALTFDLRGTTVVYATGMTPLSAASGSGRLTRDRFLIENIRGRVGDVRIEAGEADFTALSPPGEPVRFRFTARGDAGDILAVLDEPPLLLLEPVGIEADRFSGPATVRAEIIRPNRREVPRDAYRYSATADFEALTLAEIYAGAGLENARGSIDLSTQSLLVTASGDFAGSPVDIEWRQEFRAARDASRFRLSGALSGATADILGLPGRRLMRGRVGFEADAIGDFRALSALSLRADLTEAALTIDIFDWEKPQGAPATGNFELIFDADGVRLDAVSVAGDGLDISGAAAFAADGRLSAAEFSRVFIEGAADASLVARRLPAGSLDLSIDGRFLDAGPATARLLGEGPPEEEGAQPGSGLLLRARIDDVALRGGARYRDVALDFRRSADRLEIFDLSALAESGAPLKVSLGETGADTGPSRTVTARTDDLGALIAGVFDVTSVRGGRASMEILVDPRLKGEREHLTGRLEARDLRVMRAPLLARIFSAGSLTGLSDLLNGEGVELSRATAAFGFHAGELTIKEARATGPSVGLTASGAVASGEAGGAIRLSGAVAPLYQVNSLLGMTPLVGDLLVNRQGEGVMALSYQVSGQANAPLVAVNPLSALAPGILRRMFEPDAPPPPVESQTEEPATERP